MQAIVSDIIVSQALQTGQLQISQNLNNNSSNSISFSDMLNSLRQEQSTDKPVEKSEETEKNLQSSEKKTDLNDKAPEKLADETKTEPQAVQKDSAEKTDEKSLTKQLKNQSPDKIQKPAEENAQELAKTKEKGVPVQEKSDQTVKQSSKGLQKSEELDLLSQKLQQQLENETDNAELESQSAQFAGLLAENQVKKDALDNTAKTDQNNGLLINQNELELNVQENAASKIVVVDQRTSVKPEEKTQAIADRAAETLKGDNSKLTDKNVAKGQVEPVQVELNGNNTATITMDLAQADAANVTADSQTFQTMLTNQMQAAAPDFVRAGTVLLKDNDKGTINLVLHPDDLGNVKIHLSMDGKTLTAHITVNTKEALEVFKDNAQTLREAFAKNGFDTAGFDVSYNGNSNGQNQSFEEMYDGSEFMARKAYSDFLSGGNDVGYIPESYEFGTNSEYSINIVA